MVVNKKFWDGLPADIRAQLDKAMKEATAYGNGQSQKENDDALAEIKKSGKSEIIIPDARNRTRRCARRMEPVYQDVAKRVGQQLIDEFLKETQGRDQLRRTSSEASVLRHGSLFMSGDSAAATQWPQRDRARPSASGSQG